MECRRNSSSSFENGAYSISPLISEPYMSKKPKEAKLIA